MAETTVTQVAPAAQPIPQPLIERARQSLERIAANRGMDLADVLGILRERVHEVGEPVTEWQHAVKAAALLLEAQIRTEERRTSAPARHAGISGGRVIVCRQCHKVDCGHLRRRS